MTERDHIAADREATETHHEPHGAASPHGSRDDVPEHEVVVIEHDPHATLGPGPLDARRWTAGAVGIGLGLVVALCFVVAANAA